MATELEETDAIRELMAVYCFRLDNDRFGLLSDFEALVQHGRLRHVHRNRGHFRYFETSRGKPQLVLLAVGAGLDGAQRLKQLQQSNVRLTIRADQGNGKRRLCGIHGELIALRRLRKHRAMEKPLNSAPSSGYQDAGCNDQRPR